MKIGNVIGGFLDYIGVPYVFGTNTIMAHLNTSYYHIHGASIVYPTGASNVTLTAEASAWGDGGAKTEVIPADTLSTSAFDLHWLNVSAISENAELEIRIFKGDAGAEVQIGATRPVRNAVQSSEGARRIQIPQQEANERISCQLLSSTVNATTCAVSFEGHYYA